LTRIGCFPIFDGQFNLNHSFMKALKVIGIIVGVLVAAILIIPLFLPATAEVSSFTDREAWDPWVALDSTTVVTIESKPGYVGSTYDWEGERLGYGKMEVVSVKEDESIESNLWFGDMDDPATVRWSFEPTDEGTHAVWSYEQATPYPFSRLGMMIGKGVMKRSFESGLASLKEHLEANPPALSPLGPITIDAQQPFHALVAKRSGKVEALSGEFAGLFELVMEEVQKQQLQIAGPGFAHYTEYDEATGTITFLAGFVVGTPGKGSGEVMAVSYDGMKVVQAVHNGPYEDFIRSYEILERYIEENGFETTGESFEFYTVSAPQEQDPSSWLTLITFPLK
jgi:hypothetical protein